MNLKNFRCDLLDIPGAMNVRDIGGYIGEGGRAVAKRRFIRAGDLSGLTPDGVDALRGLGIGCIVDLRSTYETRRAPDTLAEDRDIAYLHVPMLDSIQSGLAGGPQMFPASMAEMYTGLLESDKHSFLRVLEAFAMPEYDAVLFHCTAGKDRTGLTAMLLLGLAGVSREDIIEDYSHSDKLIRFEISPADLPRYLFESLPETMEAALDHLEAGYGGVRGYLEHIGLTAATRSALLDKLFIPRSARG